MTNLHLPDDMKLDKMRSTCIFDVEKDGKKGSNSSSEEECDSYSEPSDDDHVDDW